MASTKLTTVIVNRSSEPLVLKVGNQNRFAKLGTLGVWGELEVEFDVNCTYQEFSLLPVKGGALKKIFVNSDDCCDFERITVTESGGKFQLDNVTGGQSNSRMLPINNGSTRVPSTNNWRTYFIWPKFNWRFGSKILVMDFMMLEGVAGSHTISLLASVILSSLPVDVT